jgi:hypothetical protein
LDKKPRRLSYANVMSTLAVALALGGGVAYAANTIGSSDIINGQVKSPDIGNNEIRSIDVRDDTLANGGLTASDLQAEAVGTSEVANDTSAGGGLSASDLGASSVGTSEVADGSIQVGDLAAPAQGARAFGLVLGVSCGDPGTFCTILRGKQLAYVAHVAEGKFCIGVNGISATDPTALPLVNPTWTGGNGWAYWRGALGSNVACAGNEFENYTGAQGTGYVDDDFTILIP